MTYNVFTLAQIELLAGDTESATQDVLMAPVRCIDCEQFVPLGWVEFGTVKCELNVGASGVVYGHRVPTEIVTHIKDLVMNRYAKADPR